MSDMLDKCFSAATLNGLTLRNRVITAATFEGMTPGGVPGQNLIEYHRRLAQGGVGMNTVAYCAPEADGRLMEDMIFMRESIRPQLEQLAAAVHAEGGALSGQLSHAGHFTQNRAFRGKRPLGPSHGFNLSGLPYGNGLGAAMGDKEMEAFVRNFSKAAAFMKSTGMDAIEIHFGHGYGLSQFISPKTNRRKDKYGGSINNRMRLPLRVLAGVRAAVGDDFPLLGKMGLTDGVRGGLGIDDAISVAKLLDAEGIDCLIPSGGTSSMNPGYMFRGDNLWQHLLAAEPNRLLAMGIFFMRPFMFHSYPYEELYFLDGSRRVRDAVQRAKVCYIGGVSTVESLETAMREFDFVAIGRALVADPDMVKHIMSDHQYRNPCTHCNQCSALIKHPDGIHCPVVRATATPA